MARGKVPRAEPIPRAPCPVFLNVSPAGSEAGALGWWACGPVGRDWRDCGAQESAWAAAPAPLKRWRGGSHHACLRD